MTKEEFIKKVDNKFTTEEVLLISFNILYNPEQVEYYNKFRIEENYDWCYDFLIKNRNLLTIEHTPEQFKEVAMMQKLASGASKWYGGYRKQKNGKK